MALFTAIAITCIFFLGAWKIYYEAQKVRDKEMRGIGTYISFAVAFMGIVFFVLFLSQHDFLTTISPIFYPDGLTPPNITSTN